MADQVGFHLGRHAKIVCPMIEYSHQITLHADAEGHYVLLRDNMLVPPTQIEGVNNVPPRLADSLIPRLCVCNLDGIILTQRLVVWEDEPQAPPEGRDIKYSVIIINARYSRRLQAALLGIAHQKDFDMSRVEVVLGYVPGIDFTDDLVDSLHRTFPSLNLVRCPFDARYARSKGFLINETLSSAQGEWIILLDADIILPPDFFARVDAVEDGVQFIAPDGRRMLSPDVTAKVLLGLEQPWCAFDRLAQEAEEYRRRESGGIPIGFCQCVRRTVFKKIQYHELDHFESADYVFGLSVVHEYGEETRLEGVDVLHLDHGGSQWYGAAKQL